MITYKTLEDGSLSGDGKGSIPIGHRLYKRVLSQVEKGEAEIVEFVNPGPSSDDLKLEGVEFDGVMCSATSEDMWGLASIKEWIRAGQTTNFKFHNGNVLELTKDNLDEFESVWVPFRASFF
jgi:hypothetical protein